jgi:hypothetical protein
MALNAGSRLHAYEIVGPIGAGGMGEVYRAHDSRLGRDVAIKVLPASLGADPGALARFEREARAIGSLNHSNIINVFDTGTEAGVTYVVMELLEGETLRGRLQESGAPTGTSKTPRQASGGPPRGLPRKKALEIAVQVAEGLAAALLVDKPPPLRCTLPRARTCFPLPGRQEPGRLEPGRPAPGRQGLAVQRFMPTTQSVDDSVVW